MSTQIKGNKGEQIITTKTDERVVSLKPKTVKTLENGKNATTMQGGYEIPIMFKEVLAGEKIESWSIDNITRIITPLVPTFDRVYMTVKAFFVPHTRVWDNAEKSLAFGEGTNTMELGEVGIPYETLQRNNTYNPLYKEHLASRYGIGNKNSDTEISMLLLRGYRAIQNDFLRVKEYEAEYVEWKDSADYANGEVEALNWCNSETTIPETIDRNAYKLAKAKARKSYWNNLKRQMFAGDMDLNEDGQDVYEHLDWQNRYNDRKKAQLDIEKNAWDIIAEMGGTQPVRADRVELLGVMDYELNYQQITQSAPQIDNSSPLGTQGGFSYTRAQGTLFNGKVFNQAGYIHILVNLNMDQIFEGNAPRELLKTNVSDYYRPGLAEKEYQVMYDREISNLYDSAITGGNAVAYQPAWEEYNRLPSYASGEMQTIRLNKADGEKEPISNSQWHNMFLYGPNKVVIDEDYFKPADQINAVLARNNIANITWDGEKFTFIDDPIFLMSEHKVKTSLPIFNNILTGTDKANEDR